MSYYKYDMNDTTKLTRNPKWAYKAFYNSYVLYNNTSKVGKVECFSKLLLGASKQIFWEEISPKGE